ncbi:MAG: CoA pyrophosphatase [Bacteroidetes bacterium]|nr:CoA pyrophosphatase [Bacteroidota bacterium]
MEFDSFIELLEKELKKPLPGKKAHLEMSSLQRLHDFMDYQKYTDAIQSSVLILLFPDGIHSEVSLVLIQRSQYEGIHSGQIGLPGGRYEKSDPDFKVTALRETYEEVGIEPHEIRIIGELSKLYIPPSNYVVYPYIGYMSYSPCFFKDDTEVEEIIILHLSDLMNENAVKMKEFNVSSGLLISAPCFDVAGYHIWGATAMILNELKNILKNI